jgi:hypothetical protein
MAKAGNQHDTRGKGRKWLLSLIKWSIGHGNVHIREHDYTYRSINSAERVHLVIHKIAIIDNLARLGCVDAKVNLQTQRANTQSRYPKHASRFDLLIDKDEDMSTLVLTTAIRPEVTAKRYSRGTRGSLKIALRVMQLAESMRTRKKENMQIDEVAESRCK